MLRSRSRALMADQPQFLLPSRAQTPSSPISSLLNSPRFFNGVFYSERAVSSPVSTLDAKNSCLPLNPFAYLDRNPSPTPEKQAPQRIGLALIDSIVEEKSFDDESDSRGNFSKPVNRTALLGSNLKVQIPIASPTKTPAEFGTKTRSPHLASPLSKSRDLGRQLSLKEMELSEDYTCVITHGPNPKTTHIFDEHIVENCCGDTEDDDDGEGEDETSLSEEIKMESNFLSFCHFCKDVLRQDKDIYMYRGEIAFCSHECRFQEMKNPEMDSYC